MSADRLRYKQEPRCIFQCQPRNVRRTDTDINMNSYLYTYTCVYMYVCVKTLSVYPLKPPCVVTPAHTYVYGASKQPCISSHCTEIPVIHYLYNINHLEDMCIS